MKHLEFRRGLCRLALAWLALLALMFASLGSAYLSLGAGNVIAGLAIASVKSGIVVAMYMRLARSGALLRIVAATALAAWLLLAGLSGVDYATRGPDPAAYQPPRQVPAFNASEDRP